MIFYCAHKRNGWFTQYALICHSVYILTENRPFEKPFLKDFCFLRGIFVLEGKTLKKYLLLAALLLALALPAQAHTRDEVRAAYAALGDSPDASPYLSEPAVAAPYAEGELTDAAREDALGLLNFARWLAGLDAARLLPLYNFRCQHGAVLLAALDYVDHDAPRPADMDADFYDSAHTATAASNIAKLNWMRPGILREGVAYFLRDDGEENLPTLGHRRWALTPEMACTGFGLANAASGNTYVVMYAHDLGAEADWENVLWPAAGAFPAELMHDHLAWSIMLNPTKYDLAASRPRVTLSERGGLSFAFDPALGAGDGFCAMNLEGYGTGPCLIFRPDFTGADFTDYEQNQVWTVRVDGLVDSGGADAPLEYEVDMISLTAQDVVNVEISQLEASLAPGEAIDLTADVIPAYADDLSLAWRSTDAAVAAVDAHGHVTAVGPGTCEIIVESAGNYTDACALTVIDKAGE